MTVLSYLDTHNCYDEIRNDLQYAFLAQYTET